MNVETLHKVDCYRASGKLLILGEYLVLDGAKSLAIPLKYGQELQVQPSEKGITWEAAGIDGTWFRCRFDNRLTVRETTNENVSNTLQVLFKRIRTVRPEIDLQQHFKVTANFPLNWGLGSSSTLVSILAQWSGTDPYDLLEHSFGGSGYDIACATAKGPITYQIREIERKVDPVDLHDEVKNHCLFVYLGQKQNSGEEIKTYRKKEVVPEDVQSMTLLVESALRSVNIAEFEALVNTSERLLAGILGRTTLKQEAFGDYPFAIKSLGAWGGDFFLATYRDPNKAKQYFSEKGLTTAFTYNEMVL